MPILGLSWPLLACTGSLLGISCASHGLSWPVLGLSWAWPGLYWVFPGPLLGLCSASLGLLGLFPAPLGLFWASRSSPALSCPPLVLPCISWSSPWFLLAHVGLAFDFVLVVFSPLSLLHLCSSRSPLLLHHHLPAHHPAREGAREKRDLYAPLRGADLQGQLAPLQGSDH